MEHDHAIDDELPEAVDCPCCGGEGVHLGALGSLDHFRCRQCGADFSQEQAA